jgi:hypothetical protein
MKTLASFFGALAPGKEGPIKYPLYEATHEEATAEKIIPASLKTKQNEDLHYIFPVTCVTL